MPKVLQRAKPWLSDIDIEKGTVGLDEIKKALAGMKLGIFFLTSENRESIWMHYEAGGLAHELDRSRICTYLLADLQIHHVKGPLSALQRTKPDKDDTRKLLHTINKAIGEEAVSDANLDAIFEKMWPELETHLRTIPSAEEMPKPLPSTDQMIAEILDLVRAAANSRKEVEWLDPFAAEFKTIMPVLIQGLKGLSPNQLLPAPPPLREPTSTFCIRIAGDPDVKRVEGTVAAETAVGQVVILMGNQVVAKFESVEGWWREGLVTKKKSDFTPEYVREKLLDYLINEDFPHDELAEIGSRVFIEGLSDLEINSVTEADSCFIVDGKATLETSTDMGEGDSMSDGYPITFVYEFDRDDGKIVSRIRRHIDTSSFFE